MILPIFLPIQVQIHYTPTFVSNLSHVVVNSSVICIVISIIVVLSNLIDYSINGYNNESSAVVIIHIFYAMLVVFALLCIAGSIKRILACLKAGFILWCVLLVFWLTTCCVQFTSWYTVRDICINNRCAESLWLSDFFYLGFEEQYKKSNSSMPPTNNATSNSLMPPDSNTTTVQPQNMTRAYEGRSRPELKRNYWYISLFVLVFVSFLFFFIFLGSMMHSFHEALCYLDEGDQLLTVPNATYIFMYPFRLS